MTSWLRVGALVVVAATFSGTALRTTAPRTLTVDAAITALVVPATATAGERLSVYASAHLPDAAVLDRRFRVCALATGECRTTGWGTLTGPGDWTGFAGSFAPERPGRYRLSWTLYAPWSADTRRAAVRAEAEVTVVAPTP